MSKCYIYVYCNPLKHSTHLECGLEPFYVGKGTGRRYLDHLRYAKTGKRSRFLNTIRKIQRAGLEPVIIKLQEHLSEPQAFEHEKHLITEWKRTFEGGPLCNLSAGGDGGAHSPETKRKIARIRSRQTITEEHRKAISKGLKGKVRPSAVCKQISQSLTGKKHDHRRRANIAAGTSKAMLASSTHVWQIQSGESIIATFSSLNELQSAGFANLYRTFRDGKPKARGDNRGLLLIKSPRIQETQPAT